MARQGAGGVGAERQLRQPDGRADRQADRAAGRAFRGRHQRQRRRARVSRSRATTSRGRRSRRSPTRWTSARRATSSAMQCAVRQRPRRRCAATSSGAAFDDAHGRRRDWRSLSASTATCSIRTARSPGWRCRIALVDQPDARGVFLATAHPAKFREVVEPAIGETIAAAAARWPTRSRVRGTRARCRSITRRSKTSCARRRLQRQDLSRMPELDDLPILSLGQLPTRDAIPPATRGTSVASARAGTSGRRAIEQLDAAIEAFSRVQGTLAQGPERLLDAFRAMDAMGALSYRVWYFASLQLRRGSARQRDQRAAPAGADPVRAPAAGERLVQPRAARDSARDRSAAGWTPTPELASTASRSRACSTSRSTCSTRRASACCRLPAGSSACRTTATRRCRPPT